MKSIHQALLATALGALAASASAQDYSMPGMDMSGTQVVPKSSLTTGETTSPSATKPKPQPKSVRPKAAAKATSSSAQHSGEAAVSVGRKAAAPAMDHAAMPGMAMPAQDPPSADGPPMSPGMPLNAHSHDGHVMPAMGIGSDDSSPSGTALPAGSAAPPAAPIDHAADQVFGADAMSMSRQHLQEHHGGGDFYQVLINLAEYQSGGRYRWDGEAWYGGDINRLVLKSEGEGKFHGGVESAEVQALYSRAVGPYFNLQGGVRQDIGASPNRSYATVGFEGLAPGFSEVEGALFLSNKGDLLGRLEGYYDQLITQRLVLQPRVELNFAAQDVREDDIGSGLSTAEVGLRLRYEIRREFAPYVGISWDRKVGNTARFARAAGQDASSVTAVVGVRAWF